MHKRFIEELTIDYNVLSDQHAKEMTILISALQQCNIKCLSLNHCQLGDKHGALFAESLPNITQIKVLNARDNQFSDQTACKIANALFKNCSLTYLDLSYNYIND